MYLLSTHFKIQKLIIQKDASANIMAKNSTLGEITDQDNYEDSKPQQLVFGQSSQNKLYDLYITGLKSVYRIKSCVATSN